MTLLQVALNGRRTPSQTGSQSDRAVSDLSSFCVVLNKHANELLMPDFRTLWFAKKYLQHTFRFVSTRASMMLQQPLITSQVSKFNLFPFIRQCMLFDNNNQHFR